MTSNDAPALQRLQAIAGFRNVPVEVAWAARDGAAEIERLRAALDEALRKNATLVAGIEALTTVTPPPPYKDAGVLLEKIQKDANRPVDETAVCICPVRAGDLCPVHHK